MNPFEGFQKVGVAFLAAIASGLANLFGKLKAWLAALREWAGRRTMDD